MLPSCLRSSGLVAPFVLITACESPPRDFETLDAGAPRKGSVDAGESGSATSLRDADVIGTSALSTADLTVDLTTPVNDGDPDAAVAEPSADAGGERSFETPPGTAGAGSSSVITPNVSTSEAPSASTIARDSSVACPSCDDGEYCNGQEACIEGSCAAGTPPCDTRTCDEDADRCCEPSDEVACGDDGNVHAVDTCGNEGAVTKTCAGDCVSGACRCIVYVNTGGSDDNDGTAWAGAKRSVSAGITTASANGCEVWVRAGTYNPGYAREHTFQLAPHVAVFGGFAGTETRRAQRDWANNVTILSGEVGSTPEDTNDNAFHVVTGADDAILDGFTITLANTEGASRECGGGVLNEGVSPTLRNLTFIENATPSSGGDLCNVDASPLIEYATFTNSRNTSSGGGHGVSFIQEGGSAVLRYVRFESMNSGRGTGGAIANSGQLLIENSTFHGLSRRDGGGAIANGSGAYLMIRDSLFDDNSVNSSGSGASNGGAIESDGVLEIVSSTFVNNSAGIGGAIAARAGSVEIVNSRFSNNTSGIGYGGALSVSAGALTVTNCLFEGNISKLYTGVAGAGGAIYMGGGGVTVVNSTFVNNTAQVADYVDGGGGALYLGPDSINAINNCLFWGNTSAAGDDLYVDSAAVLMLGTNTHSSGNPCSPERGCVSVDPEFGPTPADGDFTPSATSGCRELGDIGALPLDTLDVDRDGDSTEHVPTDFLGRPRVVGTLDVGAYEAP